MHNAATVIEADLASILLIGVVSGVCVPALRRTLMVVLRISASVLTTGAYVAIASLVVALAKRHPTVQYGVSSLNDALEWLGIPARVGFSLERASERVLSIGSLLSKML